MENEEKTENNDTLAYSPLLVALLTIFITIVILFIYKAKRTSRRAILLTGLCDSGKTLLYSRLVLDRHFNTHTSIKENVGEYSINGSSVKIVDVPGHERVRNKFFDIYKTEAKALIYVLDSSSVQQQIRDVAEYLYNILSDSDIIGRRLNVLILCNKQDLASSKNSDVIKSILEKELTMVQRTKLSQLDSVDPKVKKSEALLVEGDFEFSLLSPIKVAFANGTAVKEDGNLDELKQWIAEVA